MNGCAFMKLILQLNKGRTRRCAALLTKTLRTYKRVLHFGILSMSWRCRYYMIPTLQLETSLWAWLIEASSAVNHI
jgi:hypothetical protein